MIIGYTSGVYDLFHIGHLNLIINAKKHCDYLIAGVNTDELVMQYKKKKPVIPFEERTAIVSAIKFVDKVVVQDTLDKITAWHKYKYNFLFGGSDWEATEQIIAAKKELEPQGVKIVLFPYTQTTSSTILTKALLSL
jgi:glycerol-3-phosphate cytidylyltransferase